jgi:hypothetical protein
MRRKQTCWEGVEDLGCLAKKGVSMRRMRVKQKCREAGSLAKKGLQHSSDFGQVLLSSSRSFQL